MAAIAALSLLSLLSVYAHLLLVEHTSCPEHGELIDGPTAVPVISLMPNTQVHELWREAGAAEQHSHHHCEFVPRRRESFIAAGGGTPTLAALVSRPSAVRPVVEQPPPAIAVLRLAPKQSPPA